MIEFTRRIVGAFDSLFSSAGVTSSSRKPASARIWAMASTAPSLPYNVLMACSMADREAIIGTIFFFDVWAASSWARKFSGSSMARKRLSLDTLTGIMRYSFAIAFGTYLDIAGSISVFVRSTKSIPSWIRSVSISCSSVINPLSIRISPNRPFCFFCRSSASFSCSSVSWPMETSISPSLLFFIMQLLRPLPLSRSCDCSVCGQKINLSAVRPPALRPLRH